MAPVVERQQEEVRPRQRVQRGRGAAPVEDRVAQRRAQPLEHRGPQHERLQLGFVRGEHLAGEEVDHVRAGAVERTHQAGLVRAARERQRGEVDPGRPPLRAPDERLDVGGGQVEREPAVEELVRLGGREPQRVRAELDQLAARPQRAERQRRIRPGRDHELHVRRQVIDEPGDGLARGTGREPVEVVEHQHHLARFGERVDEPRQHHLEHGRRRKERRQRRVRQARARAAQRLDHVRPEDDGVVVALVQRDPRHRPPGRLALPPGGEQRRLAEAGRARDQGQPAARAGAQPLEEPLARDRLRRDERRVELGDEEDGSVGRAAEPNDPFSTL